MKIDVLVTELASHTYWNVIFEEHWQIQVHLRSHKVWLKMVEPSHI